MVDHTEPEIPQGPSDSPVQAIPAAKEAGSTPEISTPMFDVHAPHQIIHTWKDFLIHIAAITIGLLLAVGLEQTVEYVHRRHQRSQIEEQMRLVFSGNISSDALDLKRLADMRGALAALRSDIEARLRVRNDGAKARAGNRITIEVLVMPSMAPYESAKENGTVGLLPVERIRIYNRVYLQRQLLITVLQSWQSGTAALAEFTERFTDFPDAADLGAAVVLPELDTLRPVDLEEYLRLVASLIKRTDTALSRIALFDAECQAVLEGATDEAAFLERALRIRNLAAGSPP
jgi:hypothetical protein